MSNDMLILMDVDRSDYDEAKYERCDICYQYAYLHIIEDIDAFLMYQDCAICPSVICSCCGKNLHDYVGDDDKWFYDDISETWGHCCLGLDYALAIVEETYH